MNSNLLNTPYICPENEISKLISELLRTNLKFKTEFAHKIFSVGGFVRDQILKINSNDLDLVIEIPDGAKKFSEYIHLQFQDETTAPFQKGLGYPIWGLHFTNDIIYENQLYHTKQGSVDFADSQLECFPDPTTRQRITTFGSLTQDIRRRDFTINMIAQNLTTLEMLDLSGRGLSDLNLGLIETHPENNADQIFTDDPLRMIRAIRFASKYNFKISDGIQKSIQKNAHRIQILSGERITDELKKIILNGHFNPALKTMIELKVFHQLFPGTDQIKINFNDIKIAHDDIVLNLSVLFKQHEPTDIENHFNILKFDKTIKKNVLMTIAGLKTIETLDINSLGHQFRGFIRTYADQIEYLKKLKPDISKHIQIIAQIPIQKASQLTGHDVTNIFKAHGPQIKIILDQALNIEDELILKYNQPPNAEIIQNEVVQRLKAQFLT